MALDQALDTQHFLLWLTSYFQSLEYPALHVCNLYNYLLVCSLSFFILFLFCSSVGVEHRHLQAQHL